MPEGDTLHRAARALAALAGEQVEVEALHPRARATGVAPRLDGRRLERVSAHGKNLLLEFEGSLVLRSHLGMRGSWRVQPLSTAVRGLPWLVLRGARAQGVLRGGSRLELSARRSLPLGPDILALPLDVEGIVSSLRVEAGREIGEALLDQRLVAGIGNIWRCEALWQACVSPWEEIVALTDSELRIVVDQAARLMHESLAGGSPRRAVYRRAGRPCRRCGAPIASRPQGEAARTAYWCTGCQRGKEPAGA